MSGFHAPSFLLAVALLYLTLPLLVWALLRRRHPQPNLGLWCGGGLLMAVGFLLLGLRGTAPDFVTMQVAYGVAIIGLAMFVATVRLEAGLGPGRPLVAATLAAAALTLMTQPLGPLPRQPVTSGLTGLFGAWLAWTTLQLARNRRSRSAWLMSALYGLSAASLLASAVQTVLRPATKPADALFFASLVTALASSITGNIGFVGMALDQARRREQQQRAALQALHDNQVALETAARAREAVANERARTTRLLAHEVRQPLHNAAVALQSAVSTLVRSRDPAEAARAIEQAQGVIRRVSATLDNTVAATALLSGQGRLSTVDTDLQVLIDLSLGDLPPETRPRVQVDYRADARSARLEPTLVRLALRNLLTNATLYAPADTPVTLRLLDSDQPLALVIEVIDQGPGIPADLRERIFDEGVRGEQASVPGYGLGLHVVNRVARLHGGRIDWRPHEPQGSIFRLTLPQGDPG
jgi:signal transduction histidine kinase